MRELKHMKLRAKYYHHVNPAGDSIELEGRSVTKMIKQSERWIASVANAQEFMETKFNPINAERITECVLCRGDEVIAKGYSVCSYMDSYDRKKGNTIARGRALKYAGLPTNMIFNARGFESTHQEVAAEKVQQRLKSLNEHAQTI